MQVRSESLRAATPFAALSAAAAAEGADGDASRGSSAIAGSLGETVREEEAVRSGRDQTQRSEEGTVEMVREMGSCSCKLQKILSLVLFQVI